jgi:protein-disulfide isomerase/uncharacterized membrane protein
MTTQPVPAALRSRALETAIAVLAALGLAIAIYLVLAHAGVGGRLCEAISSERVSCDKVAASEWSVLLGVPLAAWGALAYLAALGLGAVARRPAAPPGSAGGALVLLTGAMAAVAVVLAYVSEVLIGALCPFCAASWVVSIALFVLSIRLARRAGGVAPALRADVAAAGGRRGAWVAAAGALVLAAGGLLALYRDRPAAAASGPLTVLEFSDYECPHCARMHGVNRTIVATNPQLRLERRHFPLDQACNPKITRAFHVGSCEAARAALCADAQGKFEPMDDALFANQQAKLPVETLAGQVGLDLGKFRACLAAPETAARLRQDIDQAIALGVRGTPNHTMDGRLQEGDLAKVLADAAKARQASR